MYVWSISNPMKLLRHPRVLYHFYFLNLIKITVNKILKKNIFLNNAKRVKSVVRKTLVDNEHFNIIITNYITSSEPFFCCRYGNSELVACFYADIFRKGAIHQIGHELLRKAKTGPGVFPETKSMYLGFAEMYTSALRLADMNAYWGNVIMEEYMIDAYMPSNCTQYVMRALEPFWYDYPWTYALRNKKVLIVHPFVEMILTQYKKRKEVFPNKDILPNMDLKVVKAIQSNGETIPTEYKNWLDALDALTQQCLQQDFEVALLSCGSYAVPLAARLKSAGKKAIVVGGMLQLLFGIKGARWEASRPDIVAMYNDAWVRPDDNLRVKDADKMVDGAAYW